MEERIFGVPRPGVEYRDRPGAYGIAFDPEGRGLAVHNQRKGVFLLGGGMEPGESPEDCLRREALEETGHAIAIREKVCIGEEFSVDLSGRPFHPTGHIYLIELEDQTARPVETDHVLTWMPVGEFQSKTFLRYQAWAMGMAWEAYQKQQKERLQ